MCSIDGRSFSIVNVIGFRKYIKSLHKGNGMGKFYKSKNVRDQVDDKAGLLTVKIRKEVEGKVFSFKIDALTHMARSFIGKHESIIYLFINKLIL